MPLDPREQRALTMRVSEVITNEFGFTGPMNVTREDQRREYGSSLGAVVGNGSPTDAFMISAERLVSQMAQLTEMFGAFLQKAMQDAGVEQPDPKPKGRGGRPRKDQNTTNGQGAPEAGFGPKSPDPNDPFADPNSKPQDDPFAVPDQQPQQPPAPPPQQPQQPPAPPPPQDAQLTDVQVKDALRTYMQAFGTEGTARLTDLLTRVAGVKRFSDLPANKWAAVVAQARQELGGK